jgi:hypothetical protein
LALQKSVCLRDLDAELVEINQVGLNLRNGEIDKHTSDLGSFLLTSELFYVLIDELSDLSLVVGICWVHGWQ